MATSLRGSSANELKSVKKTLASKATKPQQKHISAGACRVIVTSLRSLGADVALSAATRQALGRLPRRLKGKKTVDGAIVLSVRGVLCEAQAALQAQVHEAQAVMDRWGQEAEARARAVEAAEAHVAELEEAFEARRAALADTTKAIDDERTALSNAKSAFNSAVSEIKIQEGKKRQLELVEGDMFEPFKKKQAQGLEDTRRLKRLRNLGQQYGFHPELLTVSPAILRKQPDKRRTFDGIVLDQLSAQFTKSKVELRAAIKQSEQKMSGNSFALDEAQSKLAAAREQKKRDGRELAAAAVALEAGKADLATARHHAGNLQGDRKKAERELVRRKAMLSKFEQGPLSRFERVESLRQLCCKEESDEEADLDEEEEDYNDLQSCLTQLDDML